MQTHNIIIAFLKYLPSFKLSVFVIRGLKWGCLCSVGTTLNAEHSQWIQLRMLGTRIRGLDINKKNGIGVIDWKNMGNEK